MILTMAVDDIYAADGQKIEAFDTVFIWHEGQWYELHLTQGHIAQYAKDLAPYLEHARKSTGPKAARPPQHAVKRRKRGPNRGPRRDWSGFKAWCDLNGRVYKGAGGSFWPKKQDVADYESWLAERQAAREGQPGDTAAGGHAAA